MSLSPSLLLWSLYVTNNPASQWPPYTNTNITAVTSDAASSGEFKIFWWISHASSQLNTVDYLLLKSRLSNSTLRHQGFCVVCSMTKYSKKLWLSCWLYPFINITSWNQTSELVYTPVIHHTRYPIGGCLVWSMSYFTYSVMDVWYGGILVWWKSFFTHSVVGVVLTSNPL